MWPFSCTGRAQSMVIILNKVECWQISQERHGVKSSGKTMEISHMYLITSQCAIVSNQKVIQADIKPTSQKYDGDTRWLLQNCKLCMYI